MALAAPWLVVLGLILGIIPGIVLGLAPTAFLWGCVFAGSWLASRSLLGDTGVAIAAAGVITAVLMFAVTEPNRAASRAAHKASLLPDVTPPGRLKMAGDIRIDLPWPKWDNENSKGQAGLRGFACDNLCVALLFTPGVTSVTINSLTTLTSSEERLLTLADRRPALPSMVARLDESSGDRVPLLLSIIREHSLRHRRLNETQKGYENARKIDAERRMVMAARTALCRMGPRAGSALAPLRKMIADGLVYEAKQSGSWGEEWTMMMVRIGLPISELKKKQGMGGTDESYRERFRQKLERFDPDRDC